MPSEAHPFNKQVYITLLSNMKPVGLECIMCDTILEEVLYHALSTCMRAEIHLKRGLWLAYQSIMVFN